MSKVYEAYLDLETIMQTDMRPEPKLIAVEKPFVIVYPDGMTMACRDLDEVELWLEEGGVVYEVA